MTPIQRIGLDVPFDQLPGNTDEDRERVIKDIEVAFLLGRALRLGKYRGHQLISFIPGRREGQDCPPEDAQFTRSLQSHIIALNEEGYPIFKDGRYSLCEIFSYVRGDFKRKINEIASRLLLYANEVCQKPFENEDKLEQLKNRVIVGRHLFDATISLLASIDFYQKKQERQNCCLKVACFVPSRFLALGYNIANFCCRSNQTAEVEYDKQILSVFQSLPLPELRKYRVVGSIYTVHVVNFNPNNPLELVSYKTVLFTSEGNLESCLAAFTLTTVRDTLEFQLVRFPLNPSCKGILATKSQISSDEFFDQEYGRPLLNALVDVAKQFFLESDTCETLHLSPVMHLSPDYHEWVRKETKVGITYNDFLHLTRDEASNLGSLVT